MVKEKTQPTVVIAVAVLAVLAGLAALSAMLAWRVVKPLSAPQVDPPVKAARGTCGGACVSASGSNNELLPVNDAFFNCREMIKQCTLLEEHLMQTDKQCRPCCIKHFYLLEALAEECVTLCDRPEHARKLAPLMNDMARRIRKLHERFNGTKDAAQIHEIGQEVRSMRRELMAIVDEKHY